MKYKLATNPIFFIFLCSLTACSTTADRYKDIQKVSVADLLSDGSRYYGKQVIVEGCLAFGGSQKYKLWRYDLSPIDDLPENVEWNQIFVEGSKIPRRYRKYDTETEVSTGETTYVTKVIEDAEWRVQLLGIYLNEKAELNTGGHIVLDDYFNTTLSNAKFVSEIQKGCGEEA